MHVLTAADLFRAAWPQHTAKRAAQAAAGPVRTAQGWVQRRFRPDADTLLSMARQSAELRAELVRLLGEWSTDANTVAACAVVPAPGDMVRQGGGPSGPAAAASPAHCAGCPVAAVAAWDGVERRKARA